MYITWIEKKMNCTGTIYSYISFSFLVFHTISIFHIDFHKREREWGGSPEKKILQWLGINIFTTKMFFDSWKVSSLSLWALSITKSMCISHCTIWRQRPLFSLQTYYALFSLEISKTCFAIYKLFICLIFYPSYS